MCMKIKKEYMKIPSPVQFSEGDKEILKKFKTSFMIQEEQCYVEKTNTYELSWFAILSVLLTEEEANSGFGFFTLTIGQSLTNELCSLFEEVFNMPTHPRSKKMTQEEREKLEEETVQYKKEYKEKQNELLSPYLALWEEKKKIVTTS